MAHRRESVPHRYDLPASRRAARRLRAMQPSFARQSAQAFNAAKEWARWAMQERCDPAEGLEYAARDLDCALAFRALARERTLADEWDKSQRIADEAGEAVLSQWLEELADDGAP